MTEKPKIYRFNFSDSFLKVLQGFSEKYKYNESKIFKENWETWTKENGDIIKKEFELLSKKGYKGNFNEKMYKSVRYYYKNKSNKKVEPKKRRIYSRLNHELLIWMDSHIARNYDKKPKDAYDLFITFPKTNELIKNQYTTLSKNEFDTKIKKTYKNRFFKNKLNNYR